MHLVDLDGFQKCLGEIGLDLNYLEAFTLFYLSEKEEGRVRLGEMVGVIKRLVYNENN